MRNGIHSIVLLTTVLLAFSCVEPYAPPEVKNDQNLLVVDALLNGGDGTCTVKLSRTVPLTESNLTRPELQATVSIVTESGTTYTLKDNTNSGNYSTSGISILSNDTYILNIKTINGKQYSSEKVALKVSPQIDSITWKTVEDGIELYVDTHDNDNNTRYYRWEFDETWAYNSAYQSLYEFSGEKVVERSDNIYNCYQNFSSSNILIKSTSRFTEDAVRNFQFNSIPKGSQRLFIRYSILVKQYALTLDAFNFWELLKKNTESLGGLFDPLPSQLRGNIQNNNNEGEVVLGYFSASKTVEKRIFISLQDLPDGYKFTDLYPLCVKDTAFLDEFGHLPAVNKAADLLISGYYNPFLVGYFYSLNDCVDCRLQSGTNQKPSFW